jgi:hypothetical protein
MRAASSNVQFRLGPAVNREAGRRRLILQERLGVGGLRKAPPYQGQLLLATSR